MLDSFIGHLFHVFTVAVMAFYSLLFKNKRFDSWYFFIAFLALFHWTFFKGECFLTYIAKKQKDPSYEMGSTPSNEFVDAYPHYKTIIRFGSCFLQFCVMINVYIVLERNNVNRQYTVSFLLIYAIYYLYTTFSNFNNADKGAWLVHEITKWALIMWAILFYMTLR